MPTTKVTTVVRLSYNPLMRSCSKVASALRVKVRRTLFVAGIAGAVVAVLPSSAEAREESLIKNPGDHPDYRFEAEPHMLIGFGPAFDRGTGFGPGFRGTIVVVDNGFVKSINNSVGIGFGADLAFANKSYVFVPVVMQWNFWLSTHWSVFGEPGLGFSFGARNVVQPAFYAGGRYNFTEKIALTIRLGYPMVSVGASFNL